MCQTIKEQNKSETESLVNHAVLNDAVPDANDVKVGVEVIHDVKWYIYHHD